MLQRIGMVAAACVLGGAAHAAMIDSVSTVALPGTANDVSSVLDAGEFAAANNVLVTYDNSSRWDIKDSRGQSQTFTVVQPTSISKFVIGVARAGNAGATGVSLPFTFSFFAVDDAGGDPLNIQSTIIDAQSLNLTQPDADFLLVLELDTPYEAAPGAYGFTVDADGIIGRWISDGGAANTYAGGGAYFSSNDALVPGGGPGVDPNDRSFAIIAVPEPASLALLGLGGLVAFARRR